MGYWWILYGYLIGMAVSGRLAYWWYTLAAKRVNKKIKAENGVTRLAAPPAPDKLSHRSVHIGTHCYPSCSPNPYSRLGFILIHFSSTWS